MPNCVRDINIAKYYQMQNFGFEEPTKRLLHSRALPHACVRKDDHVPNSKLINHSHPSASPMSLS
jgi:hypothetical protein